MMQGRRGGGTLQSTLHSSERLRIRGLVQNSCDKQGQVSVLSESGEGSRVEEGK